MASKIVSRLELDGNEKLFPTEADPSKVLQQRLQKIYAPKNAWRTRKDYFSEDLFDKPDIDDEEPSSY